MYNWRLASFLAFGIMFWLVAVTSTGIIWFLVSFIFGNNRKKKDIKREHIAETHVKEESDNDDDDDDDDETIGPLSVGPGIKEELLADSPSPSPRGSGSEKESEEGGGDTSEETESIGHLDPSGSGTGFEGPGGKRIQRRRSHFREEIS